MKALTGATEPHSPFHFQICLVGLPTEKHSAQHKIVTISQLLKSHGLETYRSGSCLGLDQSTPDSKFRFFKLIPFTWNGGPNGGILSLSTKSQQYFLWRIISTIFVAHCGLMWINFWRSVYDPADAFEGKVFVFFAAAAYSVPSVGQYLLLKHGEKFVEFYNGSMVFFKQFEEQHWIQGSTPFGKFAEALIMLSILASVTQPYFIHLLYFFFPLSKVFFFPSIFLDTSSPISLIYLGALPSLWACTFGWGTCMFYGTFFLHFIYTFLFITKNITASCPEIQTSQTARSPQVAFHAYRCLQALSSRVNNLIQSSLLLLVNLVMSLAVVANDLMIVFHAVLPLSGFLVFGGYSLASAAFLFVLYIKLGEFHEFSKKFYRSWRVKVNYDPAEKNLMIKHFKSCRLNRIEMGGVGCFQKPTSIRIVGKIIYYTSKFLMVMRPKTNAATSVLVKTEYGGFN